MMRRWACIALLGLAPPLLGGCAAHPAPVAPPALPPAFPTHPSVVLKGAIAVRSRWWQSFACPELDALKDQALRGNPDLASAEARLREAKGSAAITAAPLLPALDVAGDARSRSSGGFGGRSSIAATASYEIDFWGRNRALAGSGQVLANAVGYDRDTVAITLTASVADSYFATRALRARLALARRISSDARHILGLLEAQRKVGTGSDLQVELQRTLLAGFDQSAASLERQIEQEQHLLAVLTGQAPQGFSTALEGTPEPKTPVVGVDMPLALLARRPDIAAAEARLQAAHLDVAAARAAYLPRLTLSAIGGLLAAPVTGAGAAGLALAQPLFHGGALGGQLRYDRAHADELAAAYRGTILNALRDVEDGLSAQAWLESEDRIADTAVTAASHAAFLAQAQYRLGASDYLSVLTAERASYQAEDGKLQLHLQRLQAATSLFRALGGGFYKGDGQ